MLTSDGGRFGHSSFKAGAVLVAQAVVKAKSVAGHHSTCVLLSTLGQGGAAASNEGQQPAGQQAVPGLVVMCLVLRLQRGRLLCQTSHPL